MQQSRGMAAGKEMDQVIYILKVELTELGDKLGVREVQMTRTTGVFCFVLFVCLFFAISHWVSMIYSCMM
jgi:hypothetical protein